MTCPLVSLSLLRKVSQTDTMSFICSRPRTQTSACVASGPRPATSWLREHAAQNAVPWKVVILAGWLITWVYAFNAIELGWCGKGRRRQKCTRIMWLNIEMALVRAPERRRGTIRMQVGHRVGHAQLGSIWRVPSHRLGYAQNSHEFTLPIVAPACSILPSLTLTRSNILLQTG